MVDVNPAVAVPAPAPVAHYSHMDWAAVIAGAVMAAAVSFVLFAFGSTIGLSLTSPFRGEGVTSMAMAIGLALWILIVSAGSFAIGGYLAGRMRSRSYDSTPHEVSVRDSIHGLVVWALAVLIGGVMAASAATGIAAAGGKVATAAVAGAGAAVGGAAASTDRQTADYFSDMLFRAAAGQQQPAAVPPEAAPMTAPAPGNRAAARAEAARILVMGALREEGVTEADRQQLAVLVSGQTGVSQAEARQRVDTVITEARQAADTAAAKAREAAEAARKAGVLLGFLTVASLLVSAAAASMAARAGGRHRDEGTGLVGFFA